MSPESQRLEIDLLRSKIARWQSNRQDYHIRLSSVVSMWLEPALLSLGMSASQLEQAIFTTPQQKTLFVWLAEEAFGYSHGDPALLEEYLQASERVDSGLCLRYLRRLSESTSTLWRVVDEPTSLSFIITPANGDGPSHTIHDPDFVQEFAKGDVLLTRFIDMPAGPVLGQAVFNFGVINDKVVCVSPELTKRFLSQIAIMNLEKNTGPASSASDTGPQNDNAANQERDNTPSGERKNTQQTYAAERERLMERVRKLFAMAQQAEASPHEAEIALRRCQSLMAKYGITEADLHTSEFGNTEFTSGRTIPSHVRFIASAVARLHDVLFVSGEAGFAEFRGFDVDAKVAKMTLDYLLDAIERALANRKRAGDFPAGRSAAYDYRLGFATEVQRRVRELVAERKREHQKEAGTGLSLTVRKMQIVDQECGQGLSNRTFRASRGARDATAHSAGIDDGSRVSLDQQIEAAATPVALSKQ